MFQNFSLSEDWICFFIKQKQNFSLLNHQFTQKLKLVVEGKFNYISPTDTMKRANLKLQRDTNQINH